MHRVEEGVEEGFDEPNYWHLFASAREWRPGEFDPLMDLFVRHYEVIFKCLCFFEYS